MTRYVRFESIVRRVAANPELAMCGLTRETVFLIIETCKLLNMPQDWMDGKRSLHPDIAESLALLLGDALAAVRAELDDPTSPLHAVRNEQARANV